MKSIHKRSGVWLGAVAAAAGVLLAGTSTANAAPGHCILKQAPLPPHSVKVVVTNSSATVVSLTFAVTKLSWACGWMPIGNPSATESETLLLGQQWRDLYASNVDALTLTIRANGITTRNAPAFCAENELVNGALDNVDIVITGSTVGIKCNMPANAFVANPVAGGGAPSVFAPLGN